MIPMKDDQVDRRKVEVQQCMELKRTNRDIAFLCPCLPMFSLLDGAGEVDFN